jgi:hypothetical protein
MQPLLLLVVLCSCGLNIAISDTQIQIQLNCDTSPSSTIVVDQEQCVVGNDVCEPLARSCDSAEILIVNDDIGVVYIYSNDSCQSE